MKRILKFAVIGVLTGVLLVATSIASSAKNVAAQRAANRAQAAPTVVHSKNNSRWLNTGESLMMNGYLFEGEQLVGTCSENCYGVRLTLHDAQVPEPVAHGVREAERSILEIPYEGQFTVELRMDNCATNLGCRAWVESEHAF